ncbi:MAG TPA: TonB family protein [Verrucomicrobiae bacterium]|jgi:TonB family protein|nr:TonB family protein [Verrucomicrobiae bacterium]
MNRLQKKCLIASGALHGLLLLILVFGAALMPEDKISPANRITFFDPSKVTDGPTQGGGSPQIDQAQPPVVPVTQPQPPVSAPVQPQPQPPVQPQPQPPRQDTPQFTPAPTKDAESFKPVKPKPAQTDDFTPVDRPPVQKVASNSDAAAADAKARAAAENQRRIANQINKGISRLSGSLSQATVVETSSGDDGGEAAANYRDIVYSIYHAAWNRPVSLNDDSATVVVSISIGRDGRVIRHEITKPSGNPVMDRSIETTLDNVTDIAPFPEGSKDAVRMYSLTFNLTAK